MSCDARVSDVAVVLSCHVLTLPLLVVQMYANELHERLSSPGSFDSFNARISEVIRSSVCHGNNTAEAEGTLSHVVSCTPRDVTCDLMRVISCFRHPSCRSSGSSRSGASAGATWYQCCHAVFGRFSHLFQHRGTTHEHAWKAAWAWAQAEHGKMCDARNTYAGHVGRYHIHIYPYPYP